MFRRLAAIRAARTGRGTPTQAEPDGRQRPVPAARGELRPDVGPGTTTDGSPERSAVPLPVSPLDPGAPPDYFGGPPNFAYSPLPVRGPNGQMVPGTGIRKFVEALPGLGTARQNGLGNYLPVAVPDTITYPGCDYYEIGLQQYSQQLHPDLPATRLRGYRQVNNGTDTDGHNTVTPPPRPYYLGPVIMARRDRPVRIKFINQLPTGSAGTLFLPVDHTSVDLGWPAGEPPTRAGQPADDPLTGAGHRTQNRAVLHLHGATNPWISAGNPDQWLAPAGSPTGDPSGGSNDGSTGPGLVTVPDMPPPGAGAVNLFYPNQHSGRLLWLHDNTVGLSPLNVYSGQLTLYLVTDPVEQRLVDEGVLPDEQIPLVVQDKTFVPGDSQLATQDPTWDRIAWGARGSLWYPHVFQPNQHPYQPSGRNPTGRWDYGPWLGPPRSGPGPTPNPRYDPVTEPAQPPVVPGVPHPSMVPEAFLDTPLVNGAAYPYLRVRPKAYRFRILNASNDRTLNLQLYHARSGRQMWHADGSLRDADAGEVPMVPAVPGPDRPPGWPTDGRPGGVPDPAAAGPDMVQIGANGGLLPAPVVLPAQPVDYVYDRRDATLLNVNRHALLLGPGQRADVVIDFSSVPPGSTLILYNDCPAPLPAFDPRYDHYSDGPDLTGTGGAPPTCPGYGPNTRTLLQFRVTGAPETPYDLARLRLRLPAAYGASQPPPALPQPSYDAAFGTDTAQPVTVGVLATSVTVPSTGETGPVTLPVARKSIIERIDPAHGRVITALTAAGPGCADSGPDREPGRYVGPSTETLLATDTDSPAETLLTCASTGSSSGAADDDHGAAGGLQVWRISNHSGGTEFLRFSGGQVQLINRTARDGALRLPGGTELGWQDSVRIDPAEDAVLAVRAAVPTGLPFTVGDRQPDIPAGSASTAGDRQAAPGWCYTWQSQLLGHQAYGLVRPLVLRVAPTGPTGLGGTAVPGCATELPAILLRWTNHADRPAATELLIQRATDPEFTAGLHEMRVAAGDTRYADTAIEPGVTYYHRIRAQNRAGYSEWATTGPTAVALLAPTGLTATVPAAAPLRIVLGWRNRSYTTGVQVQRATNPTFTAGVVSWRAPAGSAHLDDTVAIRSGYYYRVRTIYRNACSPWSNVATCHTPGPPAVPARLAATVVADDGDLAAVELSWAGGSGSPVGGYVVQRSQTASFTSGLATYSVPGTMRTFRNTGLTRGAVYHYRVRASNPAGTSPFSAPVSVGTPG